MQMSYRPNSTATTPYEPMLSEPQRDQTASQAADIDRRNREAGWLAAGQWAMAVVYRNHWSAEYRQARKIQRSVFPRPPIEVALYAVRNGQA